MARGPQRQGIETRLDAEGHERHRAYVRLPSTTPGKRGPLLRGKWRASLSEARSDRIQLLARKDAGTLVELTASSAYPTIAEAVDRFLADAETGRTWARGGTRYSARSLAVYETDFRLYVVPALGQLRVDAVRRSDVQALVGEVAVLRSAQRARMVVGALGALYRYLGDHFDDLPVPTARLRLPAATPPRERVLLPAELTARLDALGKRADRTFFALCGIAGLRREEAARVRVEDVDLATLTLRVRGVKKAGETTGAVTRSLPIFAPLVPELEGQLVTLDVERPGALLLPREGRNGRAVGRNLPVDADEALKRARAAWTAAGLEDEEGAAQLVPHAFRHTFASHLIAAGYDVATVSEWVGHERASTTLDVYVKPLRSRGLSPDEVRAYLGPCPWDGYPTGSPTGPQAQA